MKKISTLLLVFLCVKASAQTPITLSRADFPKPTTSSSLPDSVLYTNVITTGTTAQNTNGANQLWAEPSLSGTTQYQNFLDMSATPLAFQIMFFGSDFAQPLLNGSGLISGGTVTDAYEYYNYASNNSRLEIKGFGANISINGSFPVPIPAVYTSPDVLYRFPIAFGNTDSCVSGYSISIPIDSTLSIGLKRQQKRVNQVDAWGNVTTPAGSFDVLRVTSYIDRVDSVSTPFGMIGFPSKPIEYKWLGQGLKIPALQINATQTGSNIVVSGATFWGQGSVGTQETSQNLQNVAIYPNPSSQNPALQFSLQQPEEIDVRVFGLNGAQQAHFHFGKKSATVFQEILPLQQLQAGIYLIQIQTGAEKTSLQWLKN